MDKADVYITTWYEKVKKIDVSKSILDEYDTECKLLAANWINYELP